MNKLQASTFHLGIALRFRNDAFKVGRTEGIHHPKQVYWFLVALALSIRIRIALALKQRSIKETLLAKQPITSWEENYWVAPVASLDEKVDNNPA